LQDSERLQQAGTPPPKQPGFFSRAWSRWGIVLIVYASIHGCTALLKMRNEGHHQADMNRDVAAWKAAGAAYEKSADCGALKPEACVEHWRTVVQPNLKQTEAAWRTVEAQMVYGLAHRSVPETCRAAFADMQFAVDQYYPVEDRLVAAVIDKSFDNIKGLTTLEQTSSARVQETGKADGIACKDY
jgi:hypothetical protein